MKLLARLATLALVVASASAQTTATVLVDIGSDGFPTNPTVAPTWNDVHIGNQGSTLALRNTSGALTGIQWRIPNPTFTAGTADGTTSPQGGSPLSAFPPAATRDTMFSAEGFVIDIELTGVGPNTLVDLTFAATQMGVSDVRTADYIVQGFNGGIATLDAALNTSQTVTIPDILADASGKIAIQVRAAASNTSPDGRFYLGIVKLDLETFASKPALLGYDTPFADASRALGGTSFPAPITVSTSTGATPTVTLAATDDATGVAPTWLTIPASTTAGTTFDATFDPTGLPLGTSTGTLTASVAGFPVATVAVRFVIRVPGRLNLLFYGNSYSLNHMSVPPLVAVIGEAGGHPLPRVTARLEPGEDLAFHLNDPYHAAAITTTLPFGEAWDAVILQGQSVEATTAFGNPTAFRANAVAILANVRAHSPGAVGVLFQTWARGAGSAVYPSAYANPLAMQADIRANYLLALGDIESTFGPGTGFVAAAGDVAMLAAFSPTWYDPDLSHPDVELTLASAMVLYQAIYRERVCDVQPDFSVSTKLVQRMAGLHLGEPDWLSESGLAERCADASLRRYPGSSDDLLLLSGVNAPFYACPLESAGTGDALAVRMTTPNGVFGQDPALIFLDVVLTGAPTVQVTPWPELHVDPSRAVVVAVTPQLSARLAFNQTVLGLSPGTSLLIQGLSFKGNTARGNGLFTTTDAHEVVLQ